MASYGKPHRHRALFYDDKRANREEALDCANFPPYQRKKAGPAFSYDLGSERFVGIFKTGPAEE